jgi:hypothetical protein
MAVARLRQFGRDARPSATLNTKRVPDASLQRRRSGPGYAGENRRSPSNAPPLASVEAIRQE